MSDLFDNCILCVDDERLTLTVLKKTLEKRYDTVLSAQNGAEGLELFKKFNPSLILTDIEMPIMDGLTMGKEIKQLNPKAQVVVISAHSDVSNLLSATSFGVYDYLIKPINSTVLNAVIDRHKNLRSLENEIILAKKRTDLILESIQDIFFAVDGSWVITYANKYAQEYFESSELAGVNLRLTAPDLVSHFDNSYTNFEYKSLNSKWYEVRAFPMDTGGSSIYMRDTTLIKEYEANLLHLAYYDNLTDLPNRASLHQYVQNILAQAKRYQFGVAFLFIDLNKFKLVNDTYGHNAGDLVLTVAAERLKACVRDSDMVARYGGDEFIIVLPKYTSIDSLKAVVDRIFQEFSKDIIFKSLIINIQASVGVSLYPEDGHTFEHLLKRADMAMFKGKGGTESTCTFYAFNEPQSSEE